MTFVLGLHIFVVRLDEDGKIHQTLVDLTITSFVNKQDFFLSNLYKLGLESPILVPPAPSPPLLLAGESIDASATPSIPSGTQPAVEEPSFLRFVDAWYGSLADAFCEMVTKSNEAVDQHPPELCEEGEGGTYFLRDSQGKRVGVFKPTDEDPQSDNNPKKKNWSTEDRDTPRVSRQTIPKGEAALREVAAYELDRGFAGVPITRMMNAKRSAFASIEGPEAASHDGDKCGSLQLYIPYEDQSWNIPAYKFSNNDVHRIGIFDIRTMNTDRHGGNMLAVKRAEPKNGSFYDLVPIDHGFCFPTSFGEANWEWLYWPQSKKPFDEETLKAIESIDVDEDARILRRVGLSQEAIRVNRIATMLLKRGAAAGLNLFEIAKLCLRKKFRGTEEPSPLEVACEAARNKRVSATSDEHSNNNNNEDDDVYLQQELAELVLKLRARANSL